MLPAARPERAETSNRDPAPLARHRARHQHSHQHRHPDRHAKAHTLPAGADYGQPLLYWQVSAFLALAILACKYNRTNRPSWTGRQLWKRRLPYCRIGIAAAELAHQALLKQQQDLDKLLAGRAAVIPTDIAERIEAIATRLAVVETAESARADQTGDSTNLATVMPALSSEMLLAQTGLATLNAIMGDNSQGLDLGRWLPSLRALADAGLRVGDLDTLEKAIAVKPPSTAQLLADGRRLPRFAKASDADADITAQADDGADDGLWSSLLDGLSSFVTLQRTDNPTPATPPADQALQAALSAGQLARAAALVAGMAPDPQRDAWRAAAEARLLVDSSLADMVVALTGDLARLVTPVEGQ